MVTIFSTGEANAKVSAQWRIKIHMEYQSNRLKGELESIFLDYALLSSYSKI